MLAACVLVYVKLFHSSLKSYSFFPSVSCWIVSVDVSSNELICSSISNLPFIPISVFFQHRHWMCSFRGSKEFNVVNQLLEHVVHHDNSYFNVLSANSIIHVFFFWVIFNWLIFFSPFNETYFPAFCLMLSTFYWIPIFFNFTCWVLVIFALL